MTARRFAAAAVVALAAVLAVDAVLFARESLRRHPALRSGR